jgi:hypothetical protein
MFHLVYDQNLSLHENIAVTYLKLDESAVHKRSSLFVVDEDKMFGDIDVRSGGSSLSRIGYNCRHPTWWRCHNTFILVPDTATKLG